jgi:hydroxyethylthiazole kinase-like uncharacterized protein yjeF
LNPVYQAELLRFVIKSLKVMFVTTTEYFLTTRSMLPINSRLRYKIAMQLYTPESIYQLDRAAVTVDGIAESELMQRAGASVWTELIRRWPQTITISVFAGTGNNGGDAFVVAACALDQGVAVQLIMLGDVQGQSAISSAFRESFVESGGVIEPWNGQRISGDVIVDGLLGIGINRALDQSWQQLIGAINSLGVPRIAVDIPSGLNGLTGNAQPIAVAADVTMTFIAAKTGQLLADGVDYCGELLIEDLGVSSRVSSAVTPALETIDYGQLPPPRRNNSHKNDYGHVLVIGGDRGMSGAVSLAASAALRGGAGVVSALVHDDCRNNLAAFPEIMVQGWSDIEARLKLATVVVIGPGLGESEEAINCLNPLYESSLPMVVDAGALTADFLDRLQSKEVVITPHPGEAARLLGTASSIVQQDRMAAAVSLTERFAYSCVLKGSGTLISNGESGHYPMAINTRGNAGMASAGMGDVLSGIIAAFIAQGMPIYLAARTAVYIHALCAEQFAVNNHQISLIASDIIDLLPTVMGQVADD